MLADPPTDQADRLDVLRSFDVLDTAPEQGFDDVVALVARICDTPVALVSLVDEDRQWFKAREGVDFDQTPISQSICSHAILHEGILEIPDTLQDPRTADNPLCLDTDAPVRFYAGAPLITSTGFKLGTLCVLDHVPRRLNDLQRQTLRVLADQVMRQLELRRALGNEAILRDEIDHRVKNSLQTVMSFIRLYAGRSASDDTREALGAIGRRVEAIAQLHRELYQTNMFDRIRLDRYLERVIGLIRGSAPAHVQFALEIAPVTVDSRAAAALAMIASEFSANAIKHAFPDDRVGTVSVTLRGLGAQGYELICKDDGIGDSGADASQTTDIESIGIRLMQSAADQIGGDMSVRVGPEGYELRVITPDQASVLPMGQAGAP